MARQEQLPQGGKEGRHPALEPQEPITSYNFISEDGSWKLNLTQSFIALSTLSYHPVGGLRHRLDNALAQFIQLYQPASSSASACGMSAPSPASVWAWRRELWDDLIRSQYIGILGEPDVEESEIARKCSLDVETPLVGTTG